MNVCTHISGHLVLVFLLHPASIQSLVKLSTVFMLQVTIVLYIEQLVCVCCNPRGCEWVSWTTFTLKCSFFPFLFFSFHVVSPCKQNVAILGHYIANFLASSQALYKALNGLDMKTSWNSTADFSKYNQGSYIIKPSCGCHCETF